MKSFRHYIFLLLFVIVGTFISVYAGLELPIIIISVISFLYLLVLYSQSSAEIKEFEFHRMRFEKLILYLQKQGFALPEDLFVGKLINLINLQIEVTYVIQDNINQIETIYINISDDVDVNDWDNIKKIIQSQKDIYSLPDEFSIISVKTN